MCASSKTRSRQTYRKWCSAIPRLVSQGCFAKYQSLSFISAMNFSKFENAFAADIYKVMFRSSSFGLAKFFRKIAVTHFYLCSDFQQVRKRPRGRHIESDVPQFLVWSCKDVSKRSVTQFYFCSEFQQVRKRLRGRHIASDVPQFLVWSLENVSKIEAT